MPAWFCSPTKSTRYCQIADNGRDDTDRKAAAFERLALLDMRLQISDMPAGFGRYARPAGKPHIAQGLTHGPAAGAIARGVDVRLSHATNIGSAAEEVTEMSFLIAPRCDLDGAPSGRSELMTRAASSA